MVPKWETGAAVGVVGLAVVQAMSMYREACPPLSEIRMAPVADYEMRQRLLDADIYGGIAVLIIGGAASVLTRSAVPVVLGSSGLLLLSVYHRSVLNSPSPRQATSDGGDSQ